MHSSKGRHPLRFTTRDGSPISTAPPAENHCFALLKLVSVSGRVLGAPRRARRPLRRIGRGRSAGAPPHGRARWGASVDSVYASQFGLPYQFASACMFQFGQARGARPSSPDCGINAREVAAACNACDGASGAGAARRPAAAAVRLAVA
eukprot:364615-Chlamydomonas_euryale.AAC.51